MNRARLIVGLFLIVVALLMFVSIKGDYSTAGAVGIGMLGLLSLARSRRR